MNAIDWLSAYNRFFTIANIQNSPTYLGGGDFIKMIQSFKPDYPSYMQFLELRKQEKQSTSRKDYYWDVVKTLTDSEKHQFFSMVIEKFEPYAKVDTDAIRSYVFRSALAVPVAVVPQDLWSSKKLNLTIAEIDNAIANKDFSRAVNLAYTCLEGLYKSYVKKYIAGKEDVTGLIILSQLVKGHISEKLKEQGQFPEEIINSIVTITNAVANSRNKFSEAHFDGDAEKWLAMFARDLTNSVGRLLLNFL